MSRDRLRSVRIVGTAAAAVAAILLTPVALLITYRLLSWEIPGQEDPRQPIRQPPSRTVVGSGVAGVQSAEDGVFERSVARAALEAAGRYLPLRPGGQTWRWTYRGDRNVSPAAPVGSQLRAFALPPSCVEVSAPEGCVPEGMATVRIMEISARRAAVVIDWHLPRAERQRRTLKFDLARTGDAWRIGKLDTLECCAASGGVVRVGR